MSNFIGIGYNYNDGDVYTGADPLALTHGQIDTSGGHTIHYGDGQLRMASIRATADGGGLVMGETGTGTGVGDKGSTLQLASFSDTERGYLVDATGMLLWNTTDSEIQYYDGAAWQALGGGGTMAETYDAGGSAANQTITVNSATKGGPLIFTTDDATTTAMILYDDMYVSFGTSEEAFAGFTSANLFEVGTVSGAAASHAAEFKTGTVTSGEFDSGPLILYSGHMQGTADTGEVTLTSGYNLNSSLNDGVTGSTTVSSGDITNSSGDSGEVNVRTGTITDGGGSSGELALVTGEIADGAGSSGGITIASGSLGSSGASGGNSGVVSITTGSITLTGSSGNIYMATGSIADGNKGFIDIDGTRMNFDPQNDYIGLRIPTVTANPTDVQDYQVGDIVARTDAGNEGLWFRSATQWEELPVGAETLASTYDAGGAVADQTITVNSTTKGGPVVFTTDDATNSAIVLNDDMYLQVGTSSRGLFFYDATATVATLQGGNGVLGAGFDILVKGGTSGAGGDGGDLILEGGTGTGANDGGDTYIDGGEETGTGAHGDLYIGNQHTSSITYGSSASPTHLVYLDGNNASAWKFNVAAVTIAEWDTTTGDVGYRYDSGIQTRWGAASDYMLMELQTSPRRLLIEADADAPNDTEGYDIHISAQEGGVASASSGGEGGDAFLVAGAGGNGTLTQAAGNGGLVSITGGIGGFGNGVNAGGGGNATLGSGNGQVAFSGNGRGGDGGTTNLTSGSGGAGAGTQQGGDGGWMYILTGDGATSSGTGVEGDGGKLTITAGKSDTQQSGDIVITAGLTVSGTAGLSSLAGGASGSSQAGSSSVVGGSTATGSGGSAFLWGGAATGAGTAGDALVYGGANLLGTGTIGNARIRGGQSNAAGSHGNVYLGDQYTTRVEVGEASSGSHLRLVEFTTVQRDAISSPQAGSMVYNTTTDTLQYYDGTQWVEAAGGAEGLNSNYQVGDNTISMDNTDGEITIADTGTWTESNTAFRFNNDMKLGFGTSTGTNWQMQRTTAGTLAVISSTAAAATAGDDFYLQAGDGGVASGADAGEGGAVAFWLGNGGNAVTGYGAGDAGDFLLQGGQGGSAFASEGAGGAGSGVTIYGGQGGDGNTGTTGGAGGHVGIYGGQAGSASGGTEGAGGNVTMSGGNSTAQSAGTASIAGGGTTTGQAGSASLIGGSTLGAGTAGNVFVQGGADPLSGGTPGSIYLRGGTQPTGTDGLVYIADQNTSAIEIGNSTDNPLTTMKGSGGLLFEENNTDIYWNSTASTDPHITGWNNGFTKYIKIQGDTESRVQAPGLSFGVECGTAGPASESATAQAGGASTITLAATASDVDDFYNGYDIEITSGTGSGQTRSVSDYVGSTRLATVSSAWTTQPDGTSVYVAHSNTAAKNGGRIVFEPSGGGAAGTAAGETAGDGGYFLCAGSLAGAAAASTNGPGDGGWVGFFAGIGGYGNTTFDDGPGGNVYFVAGEAGGGSANGGDGGDSFLAGGAGTGTTGVSGDVHIAGGDHRSVGGTDGAVYLGSVFTNTEGSYSFNGKTSAIHISNTTDRPVTTFHGRLETDGHIANVGLQAPTTTAAVANVTNSADGDLVVRNDDGNEGLWFRADGTWWLAAGAGAGLNTNYQKNDNTIEIDTASYGSIVMDNTNGSDTAMLFQDGMALDFGTGGDGYIYFTGSLFDIGTVTRLAATDPIQIRSGIVDTGATAGNSGDVTVATGNVIAGSGDSGDVNLTTGTSASGTQGNVNVTASQLDLTGLNATAKIVIDSVNGIVMVWGSGDPTGTPGIGSIWIDIDQTGGNEGGVMWIFQEGSPDAWVKVGSQS